MKIIPGGMCLKALILIESVHHPSEKKIEFTGGLKCAAKYKTDLQKVAISINTVHGKCS